ncbi:Rqc2 family fibronectin-binding protein [Peptostreptococcus anaerobius]|uniref:Rqc2 family fibronectin-binding protein n=1 Tax=Peptostreptococcus anaerobius TaxID=1261 RepID=UPI00232B9F12|nr:NFACT RNA binding domain-containing protein [Peptostreptococcus anaerobius]MDB8821840.1 NFACT RNA binding domain-containing protein [Peptostreptococcus anaerobius]MDB8826469.1 NFACT RNA binding domain-containing protein [Peptostreptococcus anaerobius]MDB8828320.1 NFACT RNA binding domain-containing protein [Peptostreptococcus anaerobius]MDB8830066.1 NFACT RNA binding domain-containing protein [Peptostreptococcus anaerobius]MDB8831931.1 NFACT RNA binding domain-containing protein [Peptostrep
MAFDAIVVNSLARELNEMLEGTKIDKVYQPEKDEVCLKIRAGKDNYKLVLSASPSHPRVYIADNYEKQNPKKAPVFCMTLRKHIQSGVIAGVVQVGFERIIRIAIDSYDELREKTRKYLYVEIMGKHSNIILVHDTENRILDSIKRVPPSVSRLRQILPGMAYELPPVQDKINPMANIDRQELIDRIRSCDMQIFKAIYSNILGLSPTVAREICYRLDIDKSMSSLEIGDGEIDRIIKEINLMFGKLELGQAYPNMIIDQKRDKIVEFSSIKLNQYEDLTEINFDRVSQAIESYYISKDIKDRINQRASAMKKSLQIKLDRVNNKIKKQNQELLESEKADDYRVKGELLTSYIYMVQKGMEEVELDNFYDNNSKIRVSLNKNLTPSENAQKYFKKYNKMKNASEEISKQIKINLEESEYLENSLLAIENCDNDKDLKEIREELIREGYIKSYRMPKKDIKPNTQYLKYMSSGGNLIMVGKNNKQNDYLTLRLADNEDLWFHTKNIPGSHVVLKCAGKKVLDEEILEAATLAAYYSKAKMSANVPVDYTIKKHVKKPSGAKPGMVIYETNKTAYVTPSDEAKAKIRGYE